MNLYYLVLALCINEFIHVCSEAWAAREKVKRLSDYVNKRPHKEMNLKVNTRLKSFAFSLAIIIILTPIFYITIALLKLSNEASLILSATTLFISYVVGFIWMDKYHVDIEKVTKIFKK
jgi:predicted permease